jgi:hypothetical protein
MWVRIGSVIGGETAGSDETGPVENRRSEGISTTLVLVARAPQSVLKTVSGATRSWVRIPLLPPFYLRLCHGYGCARPCRGLGGVRIGSAFGGISAHQRADQRVMVRKSQRRVRATDAEQFERLVLGAPGGG